MSELTVVTMTATVKVYVHEGEHRDDFTPEHMLNVLSNFCKDGLYIESVSVSSVKDADEEEINT